MNYYRIIKRLLLDYNKIIKRIYNNNQLFLYSFLGKILIIFIKVLKMFL